MSTDYNDAVRESIIYDENNIKGYDKDTGRSNLDIVFEQIKSYEKNVINLTFKELIEDFILISEDAHSDEFFAFYKRDNSDSKTYDARVRVAIGLTQEDAKEYFANMLLYSAAMSISQSALPIGDVAIGNDERFIFIRGNVFVDIIGYNNESIIPLAQAIDQQIYEIITGGKSLSQDNATSLKTQSMALEENIEAANDESVRENSPIAIALSGIPSYAQNSMYNNEIFPFKQTYANFSLLRIDEIQRPVSAYYCLSENYKKGWPDVKVKVTIAETQADAKESFANYLAKRPEMAIINTSDGDKHIGDLAAAEGSYLVYVRNNLFVEVLGNKGIDVGSMAKEIDEQIVDLRS